ncbi:Global transcription factor group E4 putative isoform 2 [Tripterygium wilfordii]|uniref:Global transcription factor group E4 putative isoform 2 n=1 Tax=Tripterygium wilfordii TaxID=458696 RepID=A0A7J7CF64_TRIWF|nr:Global transcription factor group E4 putative isoform 2 [Tripterygium wilfordii]
MASATIVGEGTEGNKEKQRYTESKVYTRKAFKGLKKNNTAAPTTATDANADNNNSFTANTANNNEDNHKISSEDGSIDNDEKKKSDSIQELRQDLTTRGADSSQQWINISRLDEASDDTSSLNRQQEVAPVACEQPSENGAVKEDSEDRWKVNVPSLSKNEVRELRMKLEGELDVVRSLAKKVEEKKGPIGGVVFVGGDSGGDVGSIHGVNRVHSKVASVGVPVEGVTPGQSKSLNQLSIPTLENSQDAVENVEKEKRFPNANRFYGNSEFSLAKDKFPPAESNKRAKLNGKKQGGGKVGHGFSPGMSDYNREMKLLSVDYAMGIHAPTSRKAPPSRPPPLDMRRILDRSESMTHPPPLPSPPAPAVAEAPKEMEIGNVFRTRE